MGAVAPWAKHIPGFSYVKACIYIYIYIHKPETLFTICNIYKHIYTHFLIQLYMVTHGNLTSFEWIVLSR